jgi:hypothetical protein
MHRPLILTVGITQESKKVRDDVHTYTESLPASAPRRLYGLTVANPTKLTEKPETTDRV